MWFFVISWLLDWPCLWFAWGAASFAITLMTFRESLLTALLGGSRERRDREVLHDTIIPKSFQIPVSRL